MPGQDETRGRDTTAPAPGGSVPESTGTGTGAAGSGVPEARAPYDDNEPADAETTAGAGWEDTTEHPEDDSPLGSASAGSATVASDREDHRSLGQLVASASRDLSALMRGEIELAKAELKESAVAAGKGAGMFGAAAFLAYVAFLMLSIAAGYGLVAAGLHPAVAFVIVGGVYLLVAAIIGYIGTRSVRKAGPPARTKQSIEEAKALVGRGNGGHQGSPDGSRHG